MNTPAGPESCHSDYLVHLLGSTAGGWLLQSADEEIISFCYGKENIVHLKTTSS